MACFSLPNVTFAGTTSGAFATKLPSCFQTSTSRRSSVVSPCASSLFPLPDLPTRLPNTGGGGSICPRPPASPDAPATAANPTGKAGRCLSNIVGSTGPRSTAALRFLPPLPLPLPVMCPECAPPLLNCASEPPRSAGSPPESAPMDTPGMPTGARPVRPTDPPRYDVGLIVGCCCARAPPNAAT